MCLGAKTFALVAVLIVTIPEVSNADAIVKLLGSSKANLTVYQGDKVTLDCRFDIATDCAWIHGTTPLTLKSDRNEDCSHTLDSVDVGDAGVWVCGRAGSSNTNHMAYKHITLVVLKRQHNTISTHLPNQSASPTKSSPTSHIYLEVHPQNKSLAAGFSGVLACHYNVAVHCVWKLNGRRVKVKGAADYYYTKYDDTVPNKDCSVHIANFNRARAGFWRCSNVANDSSSAVISNKAALTLESEPFSVPWAIGLAIGILILAVNIILVFILYQKRNVRLRSRQASLNKL